MLSCNHYDLIEIACLYHFDIELHFAEFSVRGIARDTQKQTTAENTSEEGIILALHNSPKLGWYSLDKLIALTAHTHNRFFNHVEFSY